MLNNAQGYNSQKKKVARTDESHEVSSRKTVCSSSGNETDPLLNAWW